MVRYCALFLILLALVGCGEAATPTPAAPTIQATLAASNLVVGPNRLPIGIVVDGTPINNPDAKVLLRFFYLDGDEADMTDVAGESEATYFGQGLPVGIYATYPNFPQAGAWGVEVETLLPGMTEPAVSRLRLNVLAEDPTPRIGEAAPAVDTPTVADTADLTTISSAVEPNPSLYQLSVAEALEAGKPVGILFATPGFCKTATCGPSIDVVGDLQERYGEQMNFLHVEVYQYPFSDAVQANPPLLSEGMQAWNLTSEPWLFLVDSSGVVRMKYEGGITVEELAPVVEDLLRQESGA